MRAKIILLVLLLFTNIAFAAPTITNVVANPYIYLGENEQVGLTCTDALYNVTSVYADISGPNITLPRLYFTGTTNYTLTIDKLYLDRTGTFTSLLTCINENNETTTDNINIDVYQLTGSVSNITPSSVYTGDVIEIDFMLKKNGAQITSDATFMVYVDGTVASLKVAPAYDINKGWILIIDPLQAGNHIIRVDSFYDRVSVSAERQISVGQRLYFAIQSIDNINLVENSNISVTLSAKERGTSLELTKSNTYIDIGSTRVEIKEIVKSGDNYIARLNAPLLSYGTYQIKVSFVHTSGTLTDAREVNYKMQVSGKIIDNNNKAVNTRMQFLSSGIEKLVMNTDGAGSYSGSILPGTYNMKLTFPQSNVYLTDVSVNSFSDPVRYSYVSDIRVPGIVTSGIYVFEFGLSYYRADIELSYNEKSVQNEDDIKILQCPSWNSANNVCNNNWTDAYGITDKVRNVVKLNVTNLSTFAIGSKEGITLQYNFEKSTYSLRDVVRIRGITTDNNNDPIEGVALSLYNNNIPINYTTTSDANGVFLFEFLTPNTEGNYTFKITAKKTPYINDSDDVRIEVIRSRDITIISKDTFQINEGESLSEEIRITNTGQTDLTNVSIVIDGVPEYYILSENYADIIAIGEEKVINLHLFVPVNASAGTYSGTIRIVSEQLTKEKVFGFTVLPMVNINNTLTTTGFSIGLPEINMDANIYVLLFAIVCFVFAYFMKKRKKKNKINYSSTLSDIKFYMNKSNTAVDVKEIDNNGKNN